MSDDQGDIPEEDLVATYGPTLEEQPPPEIAELLKQKTAFKPWHHPIKQIVRVEQWAALTRRLVAQTGRPDVLRYFTLPGPDLLDVRILAEVCSPFGVKVEYFGFDVGTEASSVEVDASSSFPKGAWTLAETALRQAGRVTSEALILPDRLEDIAIEDSQASERLRQQEPFDIINIDACSHLAYCPAGRMHTTFDALAALLKHQLRAKREWLLFVTTRADPTLIGSPGEVFQKAITENLGLEGGAFGVALAEAVGIDAARIESALSALWKQKDSNFLKLYCVGLGKYLLQFFHMQVNMPARVQLVSAYAYRVYGYESDMLALAFRIKPEGTQAVEPGVGGAAVVVPPLEPERAVYVARRAARLWNLDQAIKDEAELLAEAVQGTKELLSEANYDLVAWTEWVKTHPYRPLPI